MAKNTEISNGVNLVNILGININIFNKKQALAKIQDFLIDGKKHFIITPNPEIILTAIRHDEEFFCLLNRADLSLPDGVGLKIAGWFIGVNLSRITGADLIKDILNLSEKQNIKIAILNWQKGLSNKDDIEKALKNKFPNLKALVLDIDRQANMSEEKEMLIQEFKPEIIFCTLGAPHQEKLVYHNLVKFASAKIGLGVGGAFDFLTGRIKRAPKVFRVIGLEWLWRLIKQPWRLKRIYNAVIVFPYKFFAWRFVLPFFYRSNVACLLYKKELETGKYKILIVERAMEPGHWQLPQGGTDGEDLMIAGRRELSEELNTNKFKPVAALLKLNVYEFGNNMSKFGVLSKKAWGYKGQKQGLFIAEFLGADSDIKINAYEHSAWRWVEAEKLVEAIYPSRRESAKIFMEKFKEIIRS